MAKTNAKMPCFCRNVNEPWGSFSLCTAVCIFCSGLHQLKGIKCPISLQKATVCFSRKHQTQLMWNGLYFKQSKWYLTIFLLSVTQFPILLSLACPSKWSNALAHPRPSLSISAPRPPSPSPSPATTTTTTIAADDDDDSVPGIDSHRYDVLKIDDTTRAL